MPLSNPSGAVGAWEKIQEQVAATGVSSFILTGIASGYKQFNLCFVGGTGGGGSNLILRFNNDPGANYDEESMQADGATVSSNATVGGNEIILIDVVSASMMRADVSISNFTSGGIKTLTSVAGSNNIVQTTSSQWNGAEISRIDLIGTFDAGSRVILYGSKA